MSFDTNESARWGQAVSTATEKYRQTADKLMTEVAGRGFMAPPGIFRLALVEAALDTKKELAKANAEIYKVRREMLSRDDEVQQKYILKLLKVDLEAYRNALEDAYRLHEARQTATLDEYRAKIDRLNADTDKRQARIILDKAEVERQITYWKRLQVAAEGKSLQAEAALITERIRTAEIKLSTLDYMGLILEAERLLLAAEKKKAGALERVLEAKRQVTEIKKSMIPLYIQKAEAKQEQAEAISKESEDRRLLELLGYEKVELNRLKHEGEHEEKLAEALYEQARLEYVRADRLTENIRNQVRRLLTEYETYVREQIIKLREQIGLEKAGLGSIASLIKTKLDAQGDLAVYAAQTQAAMNEGEAESAAARAIGEAKRSRVLASATRYTKYILKKVIERQEIRARD